MELQRGVRGGNVNCDEGVPCPGPTRPVDSGPWGAPSASAAPTDQSERTERPGEN